MKYRLLLGLGLVFALMPLQVVAAKNVHLSIDASRTGARIDRNLFGQFAENLGHGLYDGIWVGRDSSIPNTRGIRNDVVAALRELKVPNVPVAFDAGTYTHNGVSLPRVDAIAAKVADGKLLLEITNLDAENPVTIDADMTGITAKWASAETLTGAAVDSINTFVSPNTVVPKPAAVKIQNGKLSLTIAPRSVTIVSIEP